MRKLTKSFKCVNYGGFAEFSHKWQKYFCFKCKAFFIKPITINARPNECCKTEAFDDGNDYYCPKCKANEDNIAYPIDVSRIIWNKERTKDQSAPTLMLEKSKRLIIEKYYRGAK